VKKRRVEYSKRLAGTIIIGDILLSVATLGLCYLAVWRAYSGSLPYLVSLIGVFNVATGYVLGKYMDKSKAENVKKIETNPNYDRDC